MLVDEYFTGDRARSSTSSASRVSSAGNPHRNTKRNGTRNKSAAEGRPGDHGDHGDQGIPSPKDEKASSSRRRRRSASRGGRRWSPRPFGAATKARDNACGGDDASSSDDGSNHGGGGGDGGRPLSVANSRIGRSREGSSNHRPSPEKLRPGAGIPQAGSVGCSGGGMTGSGVPRGNSSGSVTAEESWSSGLGRGPDEDTSSRIGSGRLPSSRSGSRQSSSRPSSSSLRPARRYLVEQNKFRQGW